VTQLTQFVGRDVINKNTTDLAVRCSTGSVEFSCVAINTPLGVSVDYLAAAIGGAVLFLVSLFVRLFVRLFVSKITGKRSQLPS